jgi:hypothetical protein
VDGSLDQKFLISNSFVDTSTLVVNIKGPSDTGLGNQFYPIDNLVEVNENSQIYFIQEVNDEQYEILFGDGIFGKKLENNSIITLSYIVTDGTDGNGASNFSFSGRLIGSSSEIVIPSGSVSINTSQNAQNGADIESTTSIKYYAPRLYSSQYRAVTSSDYETLIKQIYPNAESVSITGGEELTPPQFGNVFISIKPQNGTYLSEFNKEQILSKLKKYSVSGIKQSIVDLKLLYVEINSSVYYNSSRVSTVDSLRTSVMNSLSSYASSIDLNTFGGRFKYSKVLHVIDNTDAAITSNITKVIIRRDLNAVINQFIQYELCFGNKFHINSAGHNIKSTAFKISSVPDTVYLTDIPNKDANGNLDGSNTGYISIIKLSSSVDGYDTVIKNAGTVDYKKGEIILNTINILSTETKDSTIQIQANPESNDIVGLRELYLYFDVSKSVINMTRDVIASGDEISGTVFVRDFYTSSYSNGALIRTAI